MQTISKTVFRAEIIDFIDSPQRSGGAAVRYFSDGMLLVGADGKIEQIGNTEQIQSMLNGTETVVDYRGKMLLPGFIDTHTHYVQSNIIASYGSQLLDWLNKYTFPEEIRFASRAYADEVAKFFIKELLRNGTTSAVVFASSHKCSVDAIFTEASKHNMCILTGKVMMDRHAPSALCDTPESAYADSKALIETWQHSPRLRYALTPRFAPTSTEAQLEVVQTLLREFPDIYVQTHVAENLQEVAWVASLFPWSRSYLDVYERYDMIRERAIYAHCIYLDDYDRQRLGECGASISFCPTSNLFLGSGLFQINVAEAAQIGVSLGTDIGGGTSFSVLRTMHEAYKVSQMTRQTFSPFDAFYYATLGGARALYLDAEIGNFNIGKAADFVVFDPLKTPLLARRMQNVETLEEKLFALMMLGDEHIVHATHILGRCAYLNTSKSSMSFY